MERYYSSHLLPYLFNLLCNIIVTSVQSKRSRCYHLMMFLAIYLRPVYILSPFSLLYSSFCITNNIALLLTRRLRNNNIQYHWFTNICWKRERFFYMSFLLHESNAGETQYTPACMYCASQND